MRAGVVFNVWDGFSSINYLYRAGCGLVLVTLQCLGLDVSPAPAQENLPGWLEALTWVAKLIKSSESGFTKEKKTQEGEKSKYVWICVYILKIGDIYIDI